jgi:hypothetical protein
MSSTDSPWAWVPEVFQLGYLFTFVEGLSAAEMIAACGVDSATAEVKTWREAVDECESDVFFRTGVTAGWAFLTEHFDGDYRDDRTRELSRGRRAVVATCAGMEEVAWLDYFEDGRCIRRFPEPVRQQAATPLMYVTLDLLTAEHGIRLDRAQVEGPLLTGEPEIDMSWLDTPSGGAG